MADDIMSNEIYTPQIGGMLRTSKLLNVFFVVDVSGSMRVDGKIDAVNRALAKIVMTLCQLQTDSVGEYEIRIAIMTFSQTARWIVPPTSVSDYQHKEIICGGGIANYSEAFKALKEKLSRNAYMAHSGKIAAPYIFLVTDGYGENTVNLHSEIEEVLNNGWIKASQRFIVRTEQDNREISAVLSELVNSNPECVIGLSEIVDVLTTPPRYIGPKKENLNSSNEYEDPFEDDLEGWNGGFDGFEDGCFI